MGFVFIADPQMEKKNSNFQILNMSKSFRKDLWSITVFRTFIKSWIFYAKIGVQMQKLIFEHTK